jgi:hypothetical protein
MTENPERGVSLWVFILRRRKHHASVAIKYTRSYVFSPYQQIHLPLAQTPYQVYRFQNVKLIHILGDFLSYSSI